ncbi:DUF1326 domain-containing protein [Georgenia thermotolerans]|uniref:DUF1326 domain-containing protein n=1 Tax=Georgenia thermotolerans TaxID=527326 RepID=A0A7J5UQ90_9MICO|nr:DUF1326 domain-containing protein [Georgenia thermotolerans]KAE8764519.1 DUF1326 domain-containing protein [Georgenia thermotolerans]
MAWQLSGTYFEHCPCGMVCPCTTSGLTLPATAERCTVTLAFHIDAGTVDGVDMAGRTAVLVNDTPRLMSEGGWRVGLYVDDGATDEQFAALAAVFSGQRGGMWAAVSALVGEMLGAERVPITYSEEGRTHRVRVGDAVDMEIEDWVVPGADEVATVTGMTFPAPVLALARSTRSHVDAFGVRMDSPGTNGFSGPFAWAA